MWSLLNSPYLIFQRIFCKSFFISFFMRLKTVICSYHTFQVKIYFSFTRVLKSKKKNLVLTSFYFLCQETRLDDLLKLICINQSRFYIFFTWENSKKFNITSKYFSILNNKAAARWVVHTTRDFITYYSCSYHSSMHQSKPHRKLLLLTLRLFLFDDREGI